ncbi:DUF4224 domain-containing protein [Hydrogenophaga sp.]|uniref:DUF4224 domain-containing protein n=1 Tax=Hydrogenophaga sp. TaxID=1904254 RepID=UPI0025C13CCB|nr:DUF4224 domain-containing protein [Hydrogenophaga sp.]MBT9467117.1 DUF4224 domain-containing protein [Hydrogenophaga sp.]
MTAGGFLDKDDLHRLTGAARANAQEAWLKAEGIPCKRQGTGVLVLWTHVHAWVEGRPTVSFVEPDFTSLERVRA